MCGIFGFAFEKGSAVSGEEMHSLLARLIKLSESRGKEAAGLALCSDRDITVYKEASRGTSFMQTETFKKLTKATLSSDALSRSTLACIGHTRLVTNGSMERHENNQPVIRDGIIAIHNGIIVNDAEMFARHGLRAASEVDTEALLAILHQFCQKGDGILSAVSRVFAELRGTASVALLFQDTPLLLIATNNGSLYTLTTATGFIFASERYILEQIVGAYQQTLGVTLENIKHVEPNSGWAFDLVRACGATFRFGEVAANQDVGRGGVALNLTDVKPEHSPAPPAVRNMFTQDDLIPYRRIFEENAEKVARMKRCTRCILPETMPFIVFDTDGVCNFCTHHVKHRVLGEDALKKKVEAFRGNGAEPDCLFPLSGGRDSSYGLHYVKNVLKLNPIAYSYDWGMLTDLGRRNQARMCGKLGVEHLWISADIKQKRMNIRRNVSAWLRRPDLGTVPLFMAGDKQYFYYLNRLSKQVRTGLSIYCENPLEQTNFKYGFCGVPPKFDRDHVYRIGLKKKLTLAFYYARHYARNPRLLNASFMDTVGAFVSTYFLPHNYIYLYQYIQWDEETINRTLREEYDWEVADDTTTTWRIGDGTAAFYNYIYYTVAGFTENDTFRSNQIREGILSRDRALQLANTENQPRFESLRWYGDTIGIDILRAIDVINAIPTLY